MPSELEEKEISKMASFERKRKRIRIEYCLNITRGSLYTCSPITLHLGTLTNRSTCYKSYGVRLEKTVTLPKRKLEAEKLVKIQKRELHSCLVLGTLAWAGGFHGLGVKWVASSPLRHWTLVLTSLCASCLS